MKNSNSDIANICLQGLGEKFLFFQFLFREVTLEAKSNKLIGWTRNICSPIFFFFFASEGKVYADPETYL